MIRDTTLLRFLMMLPIGVVVAPSLHADAAKPTYAEDVLPILKQSCLNCHNDEKQRGGLDLGTFAATMEGGSSGAAVVPGDPAKSRLFTLAAHSAEPKMPPKADKIPAANLDVIKKWIEQGARENAGSKVALASKPAAVAPSAIAKGRPAGPPPMPGRLSLDPVAVARRPGAILALAASPWAPVVAVGGAKQVLLYNPDTADLLGILPFPLGQVNGLSFSRNGKLLLAAGGRGGAVGKAVLFDLATGKVLTEVGQETDALLSADLSADQTRIAVGSPSKIVRIYATADGSLVREIKKHTDWVTAVEFSPDGVLLASGDRNGGVFVWEAHTGREFFALRGPTAAITELCWRDDGNVLAVASEDGSVRLFEMENGSQTRSIAAQPGGAAAARFSHDGRLVTTGRDRFTRLWDANGAQQKQFEALPDLGLKAVLTHDGSRVVAGDWAGNLRIWTTADAKLVATLDANPPPAAERLKRAEAAVVSAEANLKQATDALNAARAAAEKANGELAVLQKSATDAATADKAAKAALAVARPEADKQAAALAAAQAAEAARAVTHQALQEAAKKVQDVANKQPQNGELKAQAAKVADLAKAAQTELESARKAVAAAGPALKAASDKLIGAQKAADTAAAAAPAAHQKLAAEQAARKPLLDAFAAANSRVQTATAELEQARQKRDREKASQAK